MLCINNHYFSEYKDFLNKLFITITINNQSILKTTDLERVVMKL
jgi:hypothetical protein